MGTQVEVHGKDLTLKEVFQEINVN
jgi:hypothetical protein